MDKRTLDALKGSINKWIKIVRGTGTDAGATNCPLCQLFNNDETDDVCAGCPVMEQTGETGCEGTPYQGYLKAKYGGNSTPEIVKRAAQKELKFLQSLLPSNENSKADLEGK